MRWTPLPGKCLGVGAGSSRERRGLGRALASCRRLSYKGDHVYIGGITRRDKVLESLACPEHLDARLELARCPLLVAQVKLGLGGMRAKSGPR